MTDKFNEVNLIFRKATGMDVLTAHRVLMENGITTEKVTDVSCKLFRNTTEDIDKTDLDDNYRILFHILISYYMFIGAIKAYNDWMKEAATEHNMKPEKYIKIMFNLR